ncbi:MAG: BON domain-containing protein [Longimicrobiaceae bacterium]
MWFVAEEKNVGMARALLATGVGLAGGVVLWTVLSARRGGEPGHLWDKIRPTRLKRGLDERTELFALEDAVLDAFRADPVLSERGVDVGAISPGIIELSGSVHSEDESAVAVSTARGVEGVETVVNRMDVQSEMVHLEEVRRRLEDRDPALAESGWEGRRVGMGRMRQGPQTEPDRPDDSQKLRERALAEADQKDISVQSGSEITASVGQNGRPVADE